MAKANILSLCIYQEWEFRFKEWFNLSIGKKIRPVLKHQGKLNLSHKCEGTNPCWDFGTDTKGDPGAWRGMWHLNPKPWSSTELHSTLSATRKPFCSHHLPHWSFFSQWKKKNKKKIGSSWPMAQPMEKALPGCLLQLSLPSHPSSTIPVPPTAQRPQSLGGAGRDTQVQSLLGAWPEHCVMRVNKDQQGRSMAVPVYKEEPPHREGAAAPKAPPQSRPMPQTLGAEPSQPAAGSRGAAAVLGCTSSARLSGPEGLWGLWRLCPTCPRPEPWLCKEPVGAVNHHINKWMLISAQRGFQMLLHRAGGDRAPA